MRRQTKAIIAYGVDSFVKELFDLADEGWEIDYSNPPTVYGFAYEAHLTRSADITDEQRLSRAEILAKARAAKAAKAAERDSE